MEGSGRVRGGKTETSGRLFSALSGSSAIGRLRWSVLFAPGYNLPAWGINTFFSLFFFQLHNLEQLLAKVPFKP